MEPYPSGHFGFIDDQDHQFGNGSVWTRSRTRSNGPEPLLTLLVANCSERAFCVPLRIHDPDVGRSFLVDNRSVDRRRNFLVNLVGQGYPLISP
jgi:hypothetical protein